MKKEELSAWAWVIDILIIKFRLNYYLYNYCINFCTNVNECLLSCQKPEHFEIVFHFFFIFFNSFFHFFLLFVCNNLLYLWMRCSTTMYCALCFQFVFFLFFFCSCCYFYLVSCFYSNISIYSKEREGMRKVYLR